MSTTRRTMVFWTAALVVICISRPGLAEVTVLQQGVSPTADYAGCVDTVVSRRDYARASVLHCDSTADVLIRFDLSPIPKNHRIHKAVLRLADPGYLVAGREGEFRPGMVCYRIAADWDATALYEAHRKWDREYRRQKEKPAPPGAKIDLETDFGHQIKGAVATDTVAFDPATGHWHEMEVTRLVKRWLSEALPNHGLALRPVGNARTEIAASEWLVPACRPKLIVDHGPEGSKPTGIEPIGRPMPADQLDPVAATDDKGKAVGDYGKVRLGQNTNCALRGTSTDAYIKEAHQRYPGPWGWMNMSRVGGRAGDISRALLYFDLSEIPRNTSIKQARLILSLTPYRNDQVRRYRYGAFLLKLPETPGWTDREATALARKAGTPWPRGGLFAASAGRPLAVGKVTDVETEYRGRRRKIPGAVEFDLTGAVRAWVSGEMPNCGLVLDNRLEGGAYDYYSRRSYYPEKRPYLEIELSPAIDRQPEPIKAVKRLPKGDYWVEAMRTVHGRHTGKAGVLAQYGDSITITMAFLAPYAWSRKIEPKNCPPDVRREMKVVENHADLNLWKEWKSPEYGNTGMKTSRWWFDGVDAWQKRMNPEAAVILFGTNDLGGICPPEYTEYMAACVRRLLADGTVPMLTTVPPHGGRPLSMTDDYRLALVCIASHYKIPVIDYYKEALRRRPEDWNGSLAKFRPARGYEVPTIISGDGGHPSNPKAYQNDFSEKALSSNGYNLRNYMTLRTYSRVISKVFLAKSPITPE